MNAARMLPWDWYPGTIPPNVSVDDTAYIETTFSFALYRSRQPRGVTIGRGASTYLGTMFDAGPQARIRIGDYTLIHGARIICDAEIEIGDYDVGAAPLEACNEARQVDRKGGLEAFEAKQDAQRFAGRQVWIDDMDDPVTVQKRVVVNLFRHLAESSLGPIGSRCGEDRNIVPGVDCPWQFTNDDGPPLPPRLR